MSGGARDRYYQTKSEAYAGEKKHRAAQLDLQDYCVRIHAVAVTSGRTLQRLVADDVDAWQSILFPGGTNGRQAT